jgi:hypothetical protein
MPQSHAPAPSAAPSPDPQEADEKAVDKSVESVAGEEDPGAADDPTSQSSALRPPPVAERQPAAPGRSAGVTNGPRPRP